MIIRKNLLKRPLLLTGAATLAVQFLAPFGMSIASATSLSNAEVVFNRMQTSTATTGTVCAKTGTTGTESSVTVTYPTGYTLGAYTTFSVDTTTNTAAWPKDPANGTTAATAWPGITAPAGAGDISGQAVTFASGDLTAGTWYCFNWTNSAAVTTKSSATNDNAGTVATNVDTTGFSYSTATVSSDQVTVNASVPASFSFAVANTTDNLGSLTTSVVSSSGTPATATVDTNAKNGWQVWASDANAGLKSTVANYTINTNCSAGAGSNSTLSSGTKGFNTGVTKNSPTGTGTVTIATPFVGGVAGKGGGLCTNAQTVATSNGPNAGAVLSFTNNAAIDALVPYATDYSDVITITAAGLF